MIAWGVCALFGSMGSAAFAAQEVDEAEVRRWVELLNADDPARREEASEALWRKGSSIVPHLKSLLESAQPEAAERIRRLLERFDREAWVSLRLPPVRRVSLGRARRAVGEILEELERQSGDHISREDLPLEQKVEIGWDSVSVLQALDELCSALGKGQVILPSLQGEFDPLGKDMGEPAIVLDPSLSLRPVAYRDQFRAVVQDVEVNVCRGLESSVESLKVFLDLTVQPGSGPLFAESLDVLEATDDQGNSLILASPEQVENSLSPGFHRNFVLFPGAMPEFPLGVPSTWWCCLVMRELPRRQTEGFVPVSLKNPDRRARKLACLRLKTRLFVCKDCVSETLDMNEILQGPTTARFGELSFTVTGKREQVTPEHDVLLLKGELARNPKKVLGMPKLELLDDQGKTVDALSSTNLNTGSSTVTLSTGEERTVETAEVESRFTLERSSSVKSVRISAWVGIWIMEVPFEFRDIPLPER